MINIYTSICVDEDKEDKKFLYPGAMGLKPNQRALLYWKLLVVMVSALKRTNPDFKVIVYTNYTQDVFDSKINISNLLRSLDVEIKYLPFVKYRYPSHLGTMFRNVFHRLDIMAEIGTYQNNDQYILLDTDCIWFETTPEFREKLESGKIMVFDHEERTPEHMGSNNLSRLSMGETFKQLDPEYDNPVPIHYGGEFISATPSDYKDIAKLHADFYKICISYSEKNDGPPRFSNGASIFDNDEFFNAYAFGKLVDRIEKSNPFMQRILVLPHYNNVTELTYKKSIWHLMQEKQTGYHFLYDLAIDKNSIFWTCKVEDFRKVIGEYVGLPERKYVYKEKRSLIKQLKSKVYIIGQKSGLLK